MIFHRVLCLILTVMTFAPMQSWAQDSKKTQSTASASKKTTDINFEDELIEGEVKKPELMYLLQKKQFNFKRLIKLRENFLPEMRRTTEDIQRLRGGN